MSSPESPLRRRLIGALGAASSAGVVAGSAPWSALAADAAHGAAAEFLIAPGLTYLNTAALGPTPRLVLERTLAAWQLLESNPVRMAYGDGDVHLATDRAREQVARFIGCDADELLITRGTTDAMNTVAQSIRFRRGDRILTTDQEHEGGHNGWAYVARRHGLALDVVSIPPGEHDPQRIFARIADGIRRRTRVLSISHVFSANGLRLPIAEICALARRNGVLSVVDGAQALAQFALDVRALGCDAYAASGHKWLMGPKGTGLLYIRREAASEIAPVQREDGPRFVTNATGIGALPLVVGLGAAVDAMNARGIDHIERRIRALRERLYVGLAQLPQLRVVSPPAGPGATALVAAMLPATIAAKSFQSVLRDQHGLMVKRIEPPFFNGIRLSPHVFNTEAEIDLALRAIRAELDGAVTGQDAST
jgi:selenocysteine lyase/cysteine desulfurase